MLVGDLNVAAFSGGQRQSVAAEHAHGVAQHDLVEDVFEFQLHLNFADGAVAVVGDVAEQNGDFLVQKIGRAHAFESGEVNPRGVGLLGGSHGKRRRGGRACAAT